MPKFGPIKRNELIRCFIKLGFDGPFWNMYIQVEEIVSPIPISVICREDASKSLIMEAYEKGAEM